MNTGFSRNGIRLPFRQWFESLGTFLGFSNTVSSPVTTGSNHVTIGSSTVTTVLVLSLKYGFPSCCVGLLFEFIYAMYDFVLPWYTVDKLTSGTSFH